MKKIHFIGIGGIGVSALAKYYLEKGYEITGSDLVSSEITDALKKLGAKIYIGLHSSKCLRPDLKQVIYSSAILPNNPELRKAKKFQVSGYKLKVLSYPEAIGELTKQHFTIAISGTHGKSTTTAMIGILLTRAGLDPTVIVGTKLKEFDDSNCRVGKSEYLVIEADEWQASFLNYWPKIIVLANIEKEHLDFYKNLNNILKTYKKYLNHLPKNGILIANKDDKNIYSTFSTAVGNVIWYSVKDEESRKLRKILKVPGEYNVYNALSALTLARALKIPDKISFRALSQYQGSWRRFEEKKAKIDDKQITIVSDYAHHPTEIKNMLKAAREKFKKRKIWCIFQPHQYQRTFYLFQAFVKVFRNALRQAQDKPSIDKLIITDIYDVAGREETKIRKKISAKKLVEAINKKRAIYRAHKNLCAAVYFKKEQIIRYLKKNLRGGEVVIIMGAGDIYKLCEQF